MRFVLFPCAALCVAATQISYSNVRTAPFHPSIHNMGNVGLSGRLHAALASGATRIIDSVAYGGRNMRRDLAEELGCRFTPATTRVVEVGCGVGTLTRELIKQGFSKLTAVDTSAAMITRAMHENPDGAAWRVLNGVDVPVVFDPQDLAIVSMVMHELPVSAHYELMGALVDATAPGGEVWVVDISPSYQPSSMMLSGEPYVLEYLRTFQGTMREIASAPGLQLSEKELIDGHVVAYVLTRS